MKPILNEIVSGVKNTEIVKAKPVSVNYVPKNLNAKDTFTALNSSKQTKGMNIKTLVLGLIIGAAALFGFNKCTPEPVVEPQHEPIPVYPQPSEEDLEFAKNAREQLEANPELLQACLEYINDNNLISGAEDLLTGNYPAEWKISVVMGCIMSNAEMKAWFLEQIGG